MSFLFAGIVTVLMLSGYENADATLTTINDVVAESLEFETKSKGLLPKDSLVGEWILYEDNFNERDGIGLVFTEDNHFGIGAVSDGKLLIPSRQSCTFLAGTFTLEGDILTLSMQSEDSVETLASMEIKIIADRILILDRDKLSGYPLLADENDVLVRLR